MNGYRFFMPFILLGLLPAVAAGQVGLRGQVKDTETGEPVVGAVVKAKGSFTTTDGHGRFSLTPDVGADSVSFRSIGYEDLVLPVSADMSAVRMCPKATRLNDVIVEAPDIYAKGDTLVFNVERYANAKDNAIIDVIKRLPGIRVKEDGTIEYQGKPINKFYLDGNDFIGGQYGLAVNNISHKDVKAVEVMENHQPVKALEGIEFPEEAGINLKLKDDARSRWVGVARASAGIGPFLYDGSLFTMRMASKVQNMFTLKADNTGWNPAGEIRDHDSGLMFSSDYVPSLWPEYISADMVSVPLSQKRTRDNLSWLADAITTWKAGDTSMRLRLDYMGDRLDYDSGVTTDYLGDDIPDFIQDNVQRTQSHEVSARFLSETNKRGYYLRDNLSFSGDWDRSNSVVSGSYGLTQRVERKALSVGNDLRLVKRNDKRIFTITSRNAFGHRSDGLLISGDEQAEQFVDATDFRSTTETAFGKLTRFWKYYLTAGLDLDYHRMDSRLTGMGDFDNDGLHEAFLSNLYAMPRIDYERTGWRLSLDVPLKWRHYSVSGQHDYVDAYPKFSMRRQLCARSELSGSVAYRLGSPQPYLNIGVPVLSDYRNLFIAVNPDGYTQEVSASVSYRYRNPMKSLFVNLSAAYSFRRNSIMSNQLFTGDFIVNTYADRLSDNDTWHVKGGLSKGLGHSKMVVGMEAEASFASASSMRDDAVIPYRQAMAGIKPYLKGSVLKWLSANYEAEYGFSRLAVDGELSFYHSFRQNLFATVIPNDAWQFTVGAEHFLTGSPDAKAVSLVLLDASAVWRVNDKVRLSLTADNILDRRRYEYVSYGTLSRSEHTFAIRPRSILATIQFRF